MKCQGCSREVENGYESSDEFFLCQPCGDWSDSEIAEAFARAERLTDAEWYLDDHGDRPGDDVLVPGDYE
jgi:hypothetical protein